MSHYEAACRWRDAHPDLWKAYQRRARVNPVAVLKAKLRQARSYLRRTGSARTAATIVRWEEELRLLEVEVPRRPTPVRAAAPAGRPPAARPPAVSKTDRLRLIRALHAARVGKVVPDDR